MASESPLLEALRAARPELPPAYAQFDAIARGRAPGQEQSAGPAPSFEEYSLRIGPELSAWRQTCYFDVASEPGLVAVANRRFEQLAAALDFTVPPSFIAALRRAATIGPAVLQIVLGIDASAERPRLKYYLIYRDRSGTSVEALRRALGLGELPAALDPDSVYILGVDFGPRALSDFKLYVRLDSARVPRVIGNLGAFERLWRGSRYVVFQHCLLGAGRQVYFHASSAAVVERWLADRRAREAGPGPAAVVAEQLSAMNRALASTGVEQQLRPWIASLPYARGRLLPGPSNVYFHLSSSR